MSRPRRIAPRPGQESVWDYPRPPALEPVEKRIQVIFDDIVLADTRSAWRVLETSHPPVYYLPPQDIQISFLVPAGGSSFCEWKGEASYYDVVTSERFARRAAWTYHKPSSSFHSIKNHIAFYAWAMDRCLVDGEIVKPQPGRFYGGWITEDVVGPFKGEPGSSGW